MEDDVFIQGMRMAGAKTGRMKRDLSLFEDVKVRVTRHAVTNG